MPPHELAELTAARLALLAGGEIEVEGRMPWSSNATFLVTITRGDDCCQAIYKPLRGERPLWDFPSGLYRREVAAFALSEAMGMHNVPPTIVRDGPFGEGSLQFFIDADFEQHYFTMFEQKPELHDQLQAIAVFDLVANNTDRKSGHCLLDKDGKVWGIDHGLCFSVDPKLRTVIWEFGGGEIPSALVEAVRPVAERVPLQIATLLADDEVEALQHRAQRIVTRKVFPVEGSNRSYPWPLV
jgi:uncharacterized repeat protein (TIGR03843 family)